VYYGLANKRQIVEFATLVCDLLGHGSNNKAVDLLVETCAAETLMGEYRERTLYGAGAGVSQIDEGTFDWLKDKYASRFGQVIYDKLNIKLELVEFRELDYSPLLALLFARLRYWTVPKPVPETITARAEYWKEFFNTSAGKGSAEEYLERCEVAQTNVALLTRKRVS